jgi:hypothetical protein
MREYRKRKALSKDGDSPQQPSIEITTECKTEYAKESIIDTIAEDIATLKLNL